MRYKSVSIVGLTGGIGCGTSTVAEFMKKFGAKIINADRMGHRVANSDPEVRNMIKRAFGRNVYYRSGKLNRKVLGKIVFDDESKLNKLNRIIHPRMVVKIVDEIEDTRDKGNHPVVVVDAALIYEMNLERMFESIVVVAAKKSARIERIKERDGLTEAEILSRMQKQIPIEEKVKWADHTIQNNTTLETLEERTKAVYQKLTRRPATRKPKRKKTYKKNNKT